MCKWKGPSVLFVSLAVFSGCASSAKIGASRIDPPEASSLDEEYKPKDFLEDAMREQDLQFLPASVQAKLEERIRGKDSSLNDQIKVFRDSVCDGKQARVIPKHQVRLIVPKTPAGTPLDQAANAKAKLIGFARRYLKYRYLFDAATQVGASLKSADFSQYRKAFAERDPNASEVFGLRGVDISVPVVSSRDRKEIEKAYRAISYRPRFLHVEEDDDTSLMTQFFAIHDPEKRSATLVPKFARFIRLNWDRNDSRELEVSSESSAIESVADRGRQGYYRSVHFTASPYAWEFEQLQDLPRTVHPLQYAAMTDLAVLLEGYTFHLPFPIIAKMMGYKSYDPESMTANTSIQYFGYDYHSNQFTPSLAIEHRKEIWKEVLKSQTELKQADQADGSVLFELETKLDFFCEFGLAVSDLTAN